MTRAFRRVATFVGSRLGAPLRTERLGRDSHSSLRSGAGEGTKVKPPSSDIDALPKVCYVTMQFPAPSETFATNDVRWLRERGLAISVHCLRSAHPEAGPLLQERRLGGLPVTHNTMWSSLRGLLHALKRPLGLVGALRWLVSVNWGRPGHLTRSLVLLPRAFDILASIRREQPDVVHIYWAHYPSIVGHLVQESLPQIATSISFVAYDLEMEYGGTASVAQRAEAVRTLATVNTGHIASVYGVDPEQVEIIYDGIDVKRIEAAARSRPKVPGRIVSVGRLTEAKGMYEVLEVFATVRRSTPHATLRILGGGPEADGLRSRAHELGIADSVEFLGHVMHERVMDELAEAEILMLLTKASGERLPNVVKEGMASRCICVTTPTTGIGELVADGRHGFIVPAGDVEEPAKVVASVLGGEPGLSNLAEAAHSHVCANFDLDASCRKYIDLWRAAVRLRRSRLGEATDNVLDPEATTSRA